MSFASKWFHLNRFGRWCLSKTIGMNYYQGGRQEEDLCQDRAPHEISIGCSSSCITPPPNQISDSTLQCVTVVLQFSTSAHQGIATLHTHTASSWTASISGNRINSQSLEVRYILQKYSLDKYTSERAFKPSYTFLTFRPSYTFLTFKPSFTFLRI